MSYREFYKSAAQKKKENPDGDIPQINRFSDVQQVDKRRHDVLDYLILGHTASEIAVFMGISEERVIEDMKAISETGYSARDEDLEAVRDEMMRIYRLAARESHSSFQKSKRPEITEVEEEGTDSEGAPYSKRKVTKKYGSGDARHIKNMIDAAKEMGKVTGAQKHKEIEATQVVENKSLTILSPNRTQMPEEFDKWNKPQEVHEQQRQSDHDKAEEIDD